MRFDRRKSGISLIDDLPWGSRFCQFYQTRKDLLDILVPYFKAGLKNNELCVWVTTEPLSVEDVKKALEKAVPHLENFAEKGQIEIIPHSRWFARGGKSGKAVVSRVDKAVSSGFDGLRLACNAFPEKEGSKVFSCYGANAVSSYNAIALFAYPRDRFDAIGLMEIVKNHRFALVRNADRWEVIESSEARTVKDALKRSEEKLQSLFSNMSEGFAYHRVLLDTRGKPCDYLFLEVNDSFERLTGLKGKDVIGKRVTEALPGVEKDPADWIGKYGKVAMTGKPEHFESYSESLKRWYSVSAFSPHKGFFAVTLSDITERKRGEEARKKTEEYITTLNEKLKRNVEELSSANKELEAFSYTVSHDLRSPLRSIDGFSQEILEDYGDKLDNNGVDTLRRIRAASQRMGLLIDGLLNLSRLSRSEIVRGKVDLSVLAHDIAGNLRKAQPGRAVEIVIAEGLIDEGDERLLYVLLQNLLGNAWKFTGKVVNARLEFGVNQIEGGKAYFVRDNGAGFDMAFAGKLFRPFQRLHDTVDFSGTGIGLATVQRIVHRHGGRVWAEGEVGKGATFYFTLK